MQNIGKHETIYCIGLHRTEQNEWLGRRGIFPYAHSPNSRNGPQLLPQQNTPMDFTNGQHHFPLKTATIGLNLVERKVVQLVWLG